MYIKKYIFMYHMLIDDFMASIKKPMVVNAKVIHLYVNFDDVLPTEQFFRAIKKCRLESGIHVARGMQRSSGMGSAGFRLPGVSGSIPIRFTDQAHRRGQGKFTYIRQ